MRPVLTSKIIVILLVGAGVCLWIVRDLLNHDQRQEIEQAKSVQNSINPGTLEEGFDPLQVQRTIQALRDEEVLAQRKAFERKDRKRIAESLQNRLDTGTLGENLDPIRVQRAIPALLDENVEDNVVLTSSSLKYHSVYKLHILSISFVDTRSSVEQIAYIPPPSVEVGAIICPDSRSKLPFFRSGRRNGHYSEEYWLRLDEGMAPVRVEVDGEYLPESFVVPRDPFQKLIEGTGEIILLDKDGKVLDKMGITVHAKK